MLHTSKYPLRRSGRPEMVREVLSRTRTEGNRMADEKRSKISRRSFLQKTAVGAAAVGPRAAAPARLKKTGNVTARAPAGDGQTPTPCSLDGARHGTTAARFGGARTA